MKIEEIKNKAFSLRKNGKSYGQISNLLGLSKSTVSCWFKDIAWSQEVKEKLIEKSKEDSRKRLNDLNNLKNKKLVQHYLEAKKEAMKEYQNLKKDKLFIVGISLYWGEGDKVFKNGIVRISNIDGKLLKTFNNFLKKICKIDIKKIKAGILLYPDLNPVECLKFWSQEIGISEDNFFKSTIIQGKHKINRLGHGVCIVSAHNKYLKKKILVWLDLFREDFY